MSAVYVVLIGCSPASSRRWYTWGVCVWGGGSGVTRLRACGGLATTTRLQLSRPTPTAASRLLPAGESGPAHAHLEGLLRLAAHVAGDDGGVERAHLGLEALGGGGGGGLGGGRKGVVRRWAARPAAWQAPLHAAARPSHRLQSRPRRRPAARCPSPPPPLPPAPQTLTSWLMSSSTRTARSHCPILPNTSTSVLYVTTFGRTPSVRISLNTSSASSHASHWVWVYLGGLGWSAPVSWGPEAARGRGAAGRRRAAAVASNTHPVPRLRAQPAPAPPPPPRAHLDAHVHERAVGVHVALHAAGAHLADELECAPQLLRLARVVDRRRVGFGGMGGVGAAGELLLPLVRHAGPPPRAAAASSARAAGARSATRTLLRPRL
jgi:hypothetical protein